MSWLARSITNSLRLDDEDHDAVQSRENHDSLSPKHHHRQLPDGSDGDEDPDQGRGVKEDLSEFKESLTRQLWGVASFLAPPPPPPPPPPPRNKKSVSVISESKSEFSRSDNEDDEYGKLPNYSQSEDYNNNDDNNNNIIEEAVGITEEVLTFASNIAHHPETWLDFPLSEEEEFDDFDISDAQYKHALAVEHLAPRLAALRIELCPAHMSEGYFWMVYFVLLHSRLNRHDADLLSSPQLVEARAMWMQELQKQTKEESYWSGSSTFQSKESADPSPREYAIMHQHQDPHYGNMSPFEYTMHHTTAHHETDNPFNEIEYIDKSVIKEDPSPKCQEKEMIVGPSTEIPVQHDDIDYDDDDDDWLKEDSDLVVLSGTSILINEEDISFSDLEDDSDCSMPIKSKMASTEWNTTTKTSSV